MSWFTLKKSGGRRDLELSMAGLKLGSNVLQIEGDDHALIAALAKLVGLSGRACAVSSSDAGCEKFVQAAKRAGVLVEVKRAKATALPYDDEVFDLVVLKSALAGMPQNERVSCLQQAYRVLRVGGRCLVIDPAIRGGLGAVFSQRSMDSGYRERGGAKEALKAEGFRGVRLLAERDGLVFSEGTKPRAADA